MDRAVTRPADPLSALLARVEAAEGPDRELDVAIWAALQGVEVLLFEARGGSERLAYDGDLRWPTWIGQPKLTASLDLVLALVEMVLPGFHVLLTSRGGPVGAGAYCQWRASLKGDYNFVSGRPQIALSGADRPTPGLALLAALLKALIAQAEPA